MIAAENRTGYAGASSIGFGSVAPNASAGVAQPSTRRGRWLSFAATALSSSWVNVARSAFLCRYWRSSRFVFSLVPRCHGWCGSQKNTGSRQRRGDHGMAGHLAAAVPGQRPPQVCRQPSHVVDQRAGHRVGLVAVGQRDDHRVAGGAVDEGGDRGRPRSEHEITLPVAGHLPGVGLGRSLADGDHVPDLAATVRALLSARPSDRTLTPQAVEHAGVKHFPRRHVHITVDRLVRDPHRRVTGYSRRSHWAICCGDQSSSSLAATTPRNWALSASLLGFGRRARSNAAASATSARYASRPPLRAISRDTVDDGRSMRRAIVRAERPAAIPREISSRSTSVR